MPAEDCNTKKPKTHTVSMNVLAPRSSFGSVFYNCNVAGAQGGSESCLEREENWLDVAFAFSFTKVYFSLRVASLGNHSE